MAVDFALGTSYAPLPWVMDDREAALVLASRGNGIKLHDNSAGILINNA